MGYDYITTLKPDINQEHQFPNLLRNWLRLNYGIECPEDFGIRGGIPLPSNEGYLLLFYSVDQKDFGHLMVIECLKKEGWRTEYLVYGGLEAYCNHCHDFLPSKNKFCPKCGEKLTYQF